MNLKSVILITIVGVSVGYAISVATFPWQSIAHTPRLYASLASSACLNGSMLFFLVNLYRKN